MVVRYSAPLFFLALALGACSDTPPPARAPEVAAEQDSVLAVLRTVDTDALDAAYARLNVPHFFTTRVEQLNGNGEVFARRSRTFDMSTRAPSLVEADSAGRFAFGGFERFSDRGDDLPAFAANPVALVLDEDPPYLDPRGAEVFVFALAGDTLLGGQAVQILSVTARPGEDDQPLRSARLYVDASGDLVGARIVRRQASMLFKESSTTALFLQPTADGWMPGHLTTDAMLQAPLTDARHFRLSERYTFPEFD